MTSQLQRRASIPRGTGFKPAEPKPAAGPKPKACRVCRTKFTGGPLQVVCGVDCAVAHGKATTAKQKAKARSAERAKDRAARESFKTRGDWAREAQAAFNAFIRERDRAQPCICCGREETRVDGLRSHGWDAGHYRSVGSAPHLRFHEDNVHRQLVYCNREKSGNAIDYRLGLIERIGLARVEALERDQEPRHYSIDDLKLIKATYKAKLKMLKGQP